VLPDDEKLKSETRLRATDEDIKSASPEAEEQLEVSQVADTAVPPPAVINKKQKPEFVPLTKQEKKLALLKFLLVPALIWGYRYLVVPGLVVPFFHHPTCRTVMLGLVIWLIIGAVIYCQSRGWAKLLCIVLFMMPIIIADILIPVIVVMGSAY